MPAASPTPGGGASTATAQQAGGQSGQPSVVGHQRPKAGAGGGGSQPSRARGGGRRPRPGSGRPTAGRRCPAGYRRLGQDPSWTGVKRARDGPPPMIQGPRGRATPSGTSTKSPAPPFLPERARRHPGWEGTGHRPAPPPAPPPPLSPPASSSKARSAVAYCRCGGLARPSVALPPSSSIRRPPRFPRDRRVPRRD